MGAVNELEALHAIQEAEEKAPPEFSCRHCECAIELCLGVDTTWDIWVHIEGAREGLTTCWVSDMLVMCYPRTPWTPSNFSAR